MFCPSFEIPLLGGRGFMCSLTYTVHCTTWPHSVMPSLTWITATAIPFAVPFVIISAIPFVIPSAIPLTKQKSSHWIQPPVTWPHSSQSCHVFLIIVGIIYQCNHFKLREHSAEWQKSLLIEFSTTMPNVLNMRISLKFDAEMSAAQSFLARPCL